VGPDPVDLKSTGLLAPDLKIQQNFRKMEKELNFFYILLFHKNVQIRPDI